MNQYCIVEKDTGAVKTVVYEQSINDFPDDTFYKILMTPEQLVRTCSVDILSFRMNDNIPEVYIDTNKYSTCRAMNDIREKRNILLNKTDWMILPDSPLSSTLRDEILVYRQKLRDLPNGNLHPYDVVLPKHATINFPWEP